MLLKTQHSLKDIMQGTKAAKSGPHLRNTKNKKVCMFADFSFQYVFDPFS